MLIIIVWFECLLPIVWQNCWHVLMAWRTLTPSYVEARRCCCGFAPKFGWRTCVIFVSLAAVAAEVAMFTAGFDGSMQLRDCTAFCLSTAQRQKGRFGCLTARVWWVFGCKHGSHVTWCAESCYSQTPVGLLSGWYTRSHKLFHIRKVNT